MRAIRKEDMETSRLVLEYIEAVIWPVVVCVGLVMFREPLVAILHRLKGAGLPGGVSLDFGKEVHAAEVLSREVANAPRKKPEPSTPVLPVTEANARMLSLNLQPSPSGLEMTRYSELAQQDPNVALAGLRMEVEILARNLAKGFRLDAQSRDSAGTLLRRLQEAGAITSDQFQLAQKIVRLCNAAVHGKRVSREEAEAVINVARVLAKDYVEWLSWGFSDGWTPQRGNGD
jgi:hypothetical protein